MCFENERIYNGTGGGGFCFLKACNEGGKNMNSANQGGRGMGMGRGGGRGRMGGNKTGGIGGNCICPQCGHRQTHKQGVPCTTIKCPQCATMLIRE